MPLVGLDDDSASREDKPNKQNCTYDHAFNPPKNLIEDCAATVVNRMRVPSRNDIIAGRLRHSLLRRVRSSFASLIRLYIVRHKRLYSGISNAGLTRFFFGVNVTVGSDCLPRSPCSWAHRTMALPSIVSH